MNYQANIQQNQRALELGYALLLDGNLADLEALEEHLGIEIHLPELDTELRRLGVQLTR